jgi:glycosyltransferase involved in cell wall biosynthesis
MKTIFVIESLSSKGGAEHALINLVTEFQSRGLKPQIVYLWEPNDFTDSLNSLGIKTHSLSLSARWSIFSGLARLLKVLHKEQPDIINAINFFPMFYCALTKPFFWKTCRVVSFHNMGYESYPANTVIRKLRKRIDIVLNRAMDGHTAVSRAVAVSYKHHLKLSSIEIINNIIPEKKILSLLPNARRKSISKELDLEQHQIIMAGRLVPEKGYNFMISAMSLLIRRGLKVKLDIYGEGPLLEEINQDIQSYNLSSVITINESVDHTVLFNKLLLSDLLVLSSISEGLPMSAAEAMVIGTPVVATKVGGLPEMIEDQVSGVLIDSRDPNSLANAIEQVLINRDLQRKLSDGGVRRIQEKYSSDKVCINLINYFEEVHKNRGLN